MNIAVLTATGRVVVRPDTTRVKDEEDAYLPEFVNRVDYAPVVCARICKSGRSVSLKFADRYFESFTFGALLYPYDLMSGDEGFACASCLDHTTLLNLKFFDKIEAKSPNNKIVIKYNENVLLSGNIDIIGIIQQSIVEITKFCWLRVGDIVCVELEPLQRLIERNGTPSVLKAAFNSKTVFEKRIIL